MDRLTRTADPGLRELVTVTLERMAKGGVYDQLAGGFHRYSVDEHWIVPHFEKMSYDNSELLKNYVHGYQVTGDPFFATVARDIIRWMDEWLSDREHGGFYASQDADYSLDDDGDYFTWTLDEARAVLNDQELSVASLHYDIGEVGEMHHNHAKNVLFMRAGSAEISARLGMEPDRVRELLDSARGKLYSARRQRPTPYVDKTVYVSWNALCISAYLETARVLELPGAGRFALRSLDRLLSEGWDDKTGLKHVIVYSDPKSAQRNLRGLLDDYCFMTIACLDAYEYSADLTYYHFAQKIADEMLSRFHDHTSGGFFDTPQSIFEKDGALGALTTRRKPFQDAPTPAGNSAAAIALLRLFHYSNEARHRDAAEDTLETFAGVAEQFGIFGATYGLATLRFLLPPVQVVVIGEGAGAEALLRAAVTPYAVNKAVLHLASSQAVAQNLAPVLAGTIPNLPGIKEGRPMAVLCSGFTCQPPIDNPEELRDLLREALK